MKATFLFAFHRKVTYICMKYIYIHIATSPHTRENKTTYPEYLQITKSAVQVCVKLSNIKKNLLSYFHYYI